MSNRENDDERLARKWLESQKYNNIERSDDDPPDYVVDGKYAVEVKRLNLKSQINGRTEGEENSRLALCKTIKKALEKLGPPGKGKSVDVNCEYDFSRPLPKAKVVKKQIREALLLLTQPYGTNVINQIESKYLDLDKHRHEPMFGLHLCLPCGICLELEEHSLKPDQFRLLNVSNGKGVLVSPELEHNIKSSIEEKAQKIKDRKNDFDEWWLLLVDHIGYVPNSGLNETELGNLRAGIRVETPWSRIIIVSPWFADYWYEL